MSRPIGFAVTGPSDVELQRRNDRSETACSSHDLQYVKNTGFLVVE